MGFFIAPKCYPNFPNDPKCGILKLNKITDDFKENFMKENDMTDCKTSVETEYVRKFDAYARLNGLSRRKLMRYLVKWVAIKNLHLDQMIRFEQEQE